MEPPPAREAVPEEQLFVMPEWASPTVSGKWALEVLSNGAILHTLPISPDVPTFLGRVKMPTSGACGYIEVDNPTISRRHAVLVFGRGTLWLADLGSTHGTRVNKQPLQPHKYVRVAHGSVIELGQSSRRLVVCQTTDTPDSTTPVSDFPLRDFVDDEVTRVASMLAALVDSKRERSGVRQSHVAALRALDERFRRARDTVATSMGRDTAELEQCHADLKRFCDAAGLASDRSEAMELTGDLGNEAPFSYATEKAETVKAFETSDEGPEEDVSTSHTRTSRHVMSSARVKAVGSAALPALLRGKGVASVVARAQKRPRPLESEETLTAKLNDLHRQMALSKAAAKLSRQTVERLGEERVSVDPDSIDASMLSTQILEEQGAVSRAEERVAMLSEKVPELLRLFKIATGRDYVASDAPIG
jgi:pSer/pThr/pTyr-binding forkhead associated (FHA) protein